MYRKGIESVECSHVLEFYNTFKRKKSPKHFVHLRSTSLSNTTSNHSNTISSENKHDDDLTDNWFTSNVRCCTVNS